VEIIVLGVILTCIIQFLIEKWKPGLISRIYLGLWDSFRTPGKDKKGEGK
jgi:hypothetical protein